MKKSKLAHLAPLAIISLGLTAAPNLHAENRLFPTDILNQGEADVQFTVDHDTHSGNVNFSGNPGNQSQEFDIESVQLRYGLGDDWHVGAELPYQSKAVVTTDYSTPPSHLVSTSSQGEQNPSLWATYGFINDKTSPVSLDGEFLISPNTTGKEGTIYLGKLYTGWSSSDTLRLYGILSASMTNDTNVSDTDQIAVGAYKKISSNLTLIPHASYVQLSETSTYSALTQRDFGLSSNIRLARGTYLSPGITLYQNGARNSKNGTFLRDATNNGRAFSLGFYHLY